MKWKTGGHGDITVAPLKHYFVIPAFVCDIIIIMPWSAQQYVAGVHIEDVTCYFLFVILSD